VDQLDALRKKRNTTGYDMAGTVSKQEANEMVDLAKNLRSMVNGWLRAEHSELL
jgi:hypothetical protein